MKVTHVITLKLCTHQDEFLGWIGFHKSDQCGMTFVDTTQSLNGQLGSGPKKG